MLGTEGAQFIRPDLPTSIRTQELTGALIVTKLFPCRFRAGRAGYACVSSSDFLATGSELTMPRIFHSLNVSHAACFPDCKLPVLLLCVQRPLEILRYSVCALELELENEE